MKRNRERERRGVGSLASGAIIEVGVSFFRFIKFFGTPKFATRFVKIRWNDYENSHSV